MTAPIQSKLVQAIDRFGHRFMVYDHDLIGGTMLGGEFWDGGMLIPFYDRFSDLGKTAIDIGAFFGQSTVYLAKRNNQVLAVEPVYSAELVENLKLNKVDHKVYVVAAAAYSHRASMEFAPTEAQGQDVTLPFDEIGNLGGVSLVPKPEYKKNDQLIGFRMDSIVHSSLKVSLIKVDAQGCDLRALIGLRETIERWSPPILFEWEEDLARLHGDTWHDVIKFFVELKPEYTLINQGPRGYGNCWVAVPEGVEYA